MAKRVALVVVGVVAVASVCACQGTSQGPMGLAGSWEKAGFLAVLAYVSSTDIERGIIPNRAVLVLLAIRLAHLAFVGWPDLPAIASSVVWSLVSGLVVATPTALVAEAMWHTAGRRALGGGDVKLLFALGACLGWWRGLWVMALACLGGVAFVLARAAWRRDATALQRGFPLAPFVALASWAVMLHG